MSVTVDVPAIKSGYLICSDTTYLDAVNGDGSGSAGSDSMLYFGQWLDGATFRCYQTHLAFDTGAVIPIGSTVSAATLKLFIGFNRTPTGPPAGDFDIQLYPSDYVGSISTGHWKTASDLTTLLSSVSSSTIPSTPVLTDSITIPTSSALAAHVNTIGYTSICVTSKEFKDISQPLGEEYLIARAAKIVQVITMSSVASGETVTFKAWNTSTDSWDETTYTAYTSNDYPNLKFDCTGSDSADATDLIDLVNDSTYGVNGVVAQKVSGTAYIMFYLGGDEDITELEIETDAPTHFVVADGLTVRPVLTVTYDVMPMQYETPTNVLTTDLEQDYVYLCVENEIEPFATYYANMMLEARIATAMSFVPDNGNTNFNRVGGICGALDTASRHARNVATVYMCNHDDDYAQKARDILVYWATDRPGDGYDATPPTYSNSHLYTTDGDNAYNFGFHMSWDCYAFALAYDLTKQSTVYSASDHTLLAAWFDLWALAEVSYLVHWYVREDYAFSHPDLWLPYSWTVNPLGLSAKVIDGYTAWDNCVGILHALMAANNIAGNKTIKDYYLYNPDFWLCANRIVYYSAECENDGDGVPGHPIPVPCVQIDADSKEYTAPGKPGNITYMGFNGKFHACAAAALKNDGHPTMNDYDDGIAVTFNVVTQMRDFWQYLDRYTGNGTQGVDYENPPQGVGDTYNMDTLVSYEHIAAYVTDDAQLKDKVSNYTPSDEFYDAQSAGFVQLVCPIVVQNEYSHMLQRVHRGHKKSIDQLTGDRW